MNTKCPELTDVPAQAELATLREENVSAMREASSLAISIWRQHYKDVSPNFELCDSVAGIITQIDNMAAGLSEKIVYRDAELATLRNRVKVLEEALEDAANYTRHRDYDWDMGFIKHIDHLLAAKLHGGSHDN